MKRVQQRWQYERANQINGSQIRHAATVHSRISALATFLILFRHLYSSHYSTGIQHAQYNQIANILIFSWLDRK